MYNNHRAKIEILSNSVEYTVVPVHKGVKQGSVVSSSLYSKTVLPVQAREGTSCVSKGIDVLLMTYVD